MEMNTDAKAVSSHAKRRAQKKQKKEAESVVEQPPVQERKLLSQPPKKEMPTKRTTMHQRPKPLMIKPDKKLLIS